MNKGQNEPKKTTPPALLYKLRALGPEEVFPKNGKKFVLEELQKMVGGYIEVYSASGRGQIWVWDEEGRMKTDCKKNEAASKAAGFTIVGPAVLMNRKDM